MNIYKKFPKFPKYRTKAGISVIVIYVISMIIHMIKPFGNFWSCIIGVIGTVIFISCYIFCVIWDSQEDDFNFRQRYDNFDNNNR